MTASISAWCRGSRRRSTCPTGLSCHTPSIYTALGAVALGACVIEKHFTFDRMQKGPDHKSSIEGYELGELVKGCRAVWEARGATREIFPEEQQIVAWARESVVSLEADPQGNAYHARDGVGEAAEPGPRRRPGEGPRQGDRRGDQGRHRVRPANPLERYLMAKSRRVLVTLESRATFGYSVNVIKRAMADPALEVQTLLTGMHLMPELGNSQSMLHRAQIPISATVPLTPGAGPGRAGRRRWGTRSAVSPRPMTARSRRSC